MGSTVPVKASTTASSVTVQFKQLDFDDAVAKYYYYQAEYKVNDRTGGAFISSGSERVYQSTTQEDWSIEVMGLNPGTEYMIRVMPYREISHNNFTNMKTETGTPSQQVTVKTYGAVDEPSDETQVGPSGEPGTLAVGAVAGGVVGAVVVILLIVVLVIFLMRRRSGRSRKTSEVENHMEEIIHPKEPTGHTNAQMMEGTPDLTDDEEEEEEEEEKKEEQAKAAAEYVNLAHLRPSPIPLKSLGKYIAKQKMEKNPFQQEYDTIPPMEQFPCTQANRPENFTKNRFKNIKPYDRTRVILEKEGTDPTSDYINANYIKGYKNVEKHYVACQGPRPSNIPDMWRMIWQLQTNRIVMLTGLVEKGNTKCTQYWPDGKGKAAKYGEVKVTVINIEQYADFTVSTLKAERHNEKRTVYHLHFTFWTDKTPPKYAFQLLNFRHKVMSYDKKAKGPLIVHCSAGVGRTGTYMAVDYLLLQADREQMVDVCGTVAELRTQRVNMVQTVDQYRFIYTALQESLTQGHTIIPAARFTDTYQTLCKSEGNGRSQLEEQYGRLRAFIPKQTADSLKTAIAPENRDKNRDIKLAARDTVRPMLNTHVEGRTDYINAVFVDSYRSREGMLATHMPLPDTVVDLWRLVLDYSCTVIVMLNTHDDTDQTSGKYWPDNTQDSLTFGPLNIEMTSVNQEHPNIMTRDLTLTTDNQAPLSVRQYQVSGPWVGEDDTGAAETVCDVLEQLERWQQQNTSRSDKILVHCSDGVSRTGVFCACLHITEKLRVEQEVDIYTAVKHVKTSREQFIGSMAQYEFLHKLVECYIARFDTYANFR